MPADLARYSGSATPLPELSSFDFQRSSESPARSPRAQEPNRLEQARDRAQLVSFNFLNPLICMVASSARTGRADRAAAGLPL
jgi:hypothetical protein